MCEFGNEYHFENESEAKDLLEKSRNEIDLIDVELIDLISRRTDLARDILFAKKFLDMDIYDKNRENSIHDKVNKLAIEKDIDEVILNEIMNQLTILSKNKQKEILKEV